MTLKKEEPYVSNNHLLIIDSKKNEEWITQPMFTDVEYPIFGKVLFLLCGVVAFGLSFGMPTGLSVFFLDWQSSFQSSRASTAAIHATCIGTLNIGAIVPGLLINRIGARTTLLLGALVSFLGMLMSYFATSVVFMTMSTGVVFGLGCSMLNLPLIPCVTKVFKSRQSLVIASLSFGSGVLNTCLPYMYRGMAQEYGWRGACLLIGALSLQSCVTGLVVTSLGRAKRCQVTNDLKNEYGEIADHHPISLMKSSAENTQLDSKPLLQFSPTLNGNTNVLNEEKIVSTSAENNTSGEQRYHDINHTTQGRTHTSNIEQRKTGNCVEHQQLYDDEFCNVGNPESDENKAPVSELGDSADNEGLIYQPALKSDKNMTNSDCADMKTSDCNGCNGIILLEDEKGENSSDKSERNSCRLSHKNAIGIIVNNPKITEPHGSTITKMNGFPSLKNTHMPQNNASYGYASKDEACGDNCCLSFKTTDNTLPTFSSRIITSFSNLTNSHPFFSDPVYIVLSVTVAFCLSALYTFVALMMDFAKGKGYDESVAVFFVFLVFLFSMSGKLVTGSLNLIPKLHSVYIFGVYGIISSILIVIFNIITAYYSLCVLLSFMGYVLGGFAAIYPKAVLDMKSVTSTTYPLALGITISIEGIFDSLLPVIAGYTMDRYHSYSPVVYAYSALSALLSIALISIFYYKQHKYSKRNAMKT